jgi:D-alanyl-D-alanine carboxypeptidase/D-alanyl-D-alanine-endopeptidase (penicillin-binding protein 4)
MEFCGWGQIRASPAWDAMVYRRGWLLAGGASLTGVAYNRAGKRISGAKTLMARHRIVKALAFALVLLLAAPLAQPQAHPRRAPVARSEARPDLVRFRARVGAALDDVHAQKAYWGVLIADAKTGEALYELNPERAFVPASNTKLFTTALAMATFGPDYRFRTTIESRGTLDPDGRLHGDLVLVGRGDPSLSNRKFPYQGKVERDGPADKALGEIADAVVAKGVKEIDGDIVGDDSYFPYDPYPAGWTVGDLYFSFGAPVSAIAVNDNVLLVEVNPGQHEGAPASLTINPWAGYETFGHDITTGPVGSKPKFEVVRQPGPYPILLRGSIPVGAEPVKLDLAMEDPAEYAAHLLKRLLEARGVRITGQARGQHALLPPNGVSLAAAGDPQIGRAHV